jgi:hypothetical protein
MLTVSTIETSDIRASSEVRIAFQDAKYWARMHSGDLRCPLRWIELCCAWLAAILTGSTPTSRPTHPT